MAIWHDSFPIELVRQQSQNTLISLLGIEIIEAGDEYLKGRMPVDERTYRPARMLHGGASAVLAETLASWGALYVVDRARYHCVGLEINANHVRAVASGFLLGVARPLHLGRSTQIWDVRITDEQDRLVCVSRVTMAVLKTESRASNERG